MHSRQQQLIQKPIAGQHITLVAIKDTPKQASLPYSKLRKPEVLSALEASLTFHFASHGGANTASPLHSQLLLRDSIDDPLIVESLLGINIGSTSPFLAYLSAYGADKNRGERLANKGIHLTAASKFAGFRHIIGTLWSVDDRIYVDMAEADLRSERNTLRADNAVMILPWVSLLQTCKTVYDELSAFMDLVSVTSDPDHNVYVIDIAVHHGDHLLSTTWGHVPCHPIKVREVVANIRFDWVDPTRLIGQGDVFKSWGAGGPMPIVAQLYQSINLLLHHGPAFTQQVPLPDGHLKLNTLTMNIYAPRRPFEDDSFKRIHEAYLPLISELHRPYADLQPACAPIYMRGHGHQALASSRHIDRASFIGHDVSEMKES
ncbi:hypothetical protein F4859DRAFT_527693 [Xylaria cf. heliscus]|nr:hypothetical protein F4859DRAFT_527693 [Xylaria cf. heliscus]